MGPCPKVHSFQLRKEYHFPPLLYILCYYFDYCSRVSKACHSISGALYIINGQGFAELCFAWFLNRLQFATCLLSTLWIYMLMLFLRLIVFLYVQSSSYGSHIWYMRIEYFQCHCYLTTIRYQETKTKGQDSYDRELENVIDRLIVLCQRLRRWMILTPLAFSRPHCLYAHVYQFIYLSNLLLCRMCRRLRFLSCQSK